ncbi:hypothetical protein NT6N_13430 [Oceaniferula spumae]|uniref:Histidine kinase domain-containing protein n=1 Tax=Oceaniferula spumae TaxID=2979115 RepID=A0AAT9FK11_9BACT
MMLSLGGVVQAQNTKSLVRSWQTGDGLPSNTVRLITQTTDGFMWLGTEAGLARFDGLNFISFGPREGFPAVAVSALTAMSDGALWVGYWRYGLLRLKDNKVTTFTTAEGLPGNTIRSLSEGPDGTLWVGTNKGLIRWTGEGFAVIPDPPGLSDTQAILARHNGEVWVNFNKRTLRIWNGAEWNEPRIAPPVGIARRTNLAEDSQGKVWALSHAGSVLSFDENGWTEFPLHQPPSKANGRPIAISPDGEVYIGHLGSGLWKLKGSAFEPVSVDDGNGEALVEGLYFDGLGQLWIGSFSSGLLSLSPRRLESIRIDSQNNADPVRALFEAKPGEMWIGTQGLGVWHRSHGVNKRLSPDAGFPLGSSCEAIVRSHDGSIIVAGTEIYQYNDEKLTAVLDLPDRKELIFTMAVGADSVFVGTGSGRILKLQQGKVSLLAEPQGSGSVLSMTVGADQTLWAGTWGKGVRRIRGNEDQFLSIADGLRSNIVNAVYLDAEDTLWVGTRSGGLARWHDGRFQSIGKEEGLLDDTINQIIEDGEGRLWLGGLRGISVVQKSELEEVFAGRADSVHPRGFGKADGMDSTECLEMQPIRDSAGRLCFGTTRGYVRINPRSEVISRPSRVLIENVAVDGRSQFLGFDSSTPPALKLQPGVAQISIRYTAPEFVSPEQLRFRYRLTGSDDDWHDLGDQRTVNFHRLPPGTYHFEVAAVSPGGVSVTSAPLSFTLPPYYWQTGWFLACCILAGLLIIIAAVWTVMHQRAVRKKALLEQQRAVDAERVRISNDLHDDLGASLTEIALYSDLAKSDLDTPEEASEHLEHIFVTARNSTRALDQIIWATNPRNDSLDKFAAFLSKQVQDLARAAGMSCHLDMPNPIPPIVLSAAVRHHLFLGTREAVHNAAKHSGGQTLTLRLAFEGKSFRFVVQDDGQGCSDKPLEMDADGLENMNRRMSEIGGEFSISSIPGEGTKVRFRVPMREAVNSPAEEV